MTQAEFNSYRFSSGEEPSEEMLSKLMEDAATEARDSNIEAEKRYFDDLRRKADEIRRNNAISAQSQDPEQ